MCNLIASIYQIIASIGLEMHNNFPLLYQKTAFDFFKKFDGNPTDQYAADYMFYVRLVACTNVYICILYVMKLHINVILLLYSVTLLRAIFL